MTVITEARVAKVLRYAAILALVALALMVWSLVDPRPPPILIALSVGQALGTASFLAYLFAVTWDLQRLRRRARRAPREDAEPSSPPEPPPSAEKSA